MTEQAGRWLRVSSNGQDEKSQVPDVDTWCQEHGYEIAATYQVHGRSAYKANKHFDAEWAKVLADLRSGKITVLVTWKQDRLDRKLATFEMLKQVVEAGGRVEFTTQPWLNDLTTMGGRIALKVQEEIAHAESKDKSDRVIAKHRSLRDANRLVGKLPFGYVAVCDDPQCATVTTATTRCRRHPKTAMIDAANKTTIETIFDLYTSGRSLTQIAKHLDAAGLKPGFGGGWWPKSLAEILANQAYAGRRVNAHGVTVQTIPAIVSEGQAQAARQRLADTGTRKGRPSLETAPLTGIALCRICAGPMYRIKTGAFTYYRCWGSSRAPSTCKVMLRADDLEAAVVAAVAAEIDEGTFRATRVVPGHTWNDEIARCDDEISDLTARMQAGELDASEFAVKVAEVAAERQRLASLPPVPATTEKITTDITRRQHWLNMPPAEQRDYLLDANVVAYAGKSGDGNVDVLLGVKSVPRRRRRAA